MGRVKRDREAREAALGVRHYRVRRWTGFEMQEADDDARKQREQHLQSVAGKVELKFRKQCPDFEPSVKQVRLSGRPELLFELVVRATDEGDARQRAMYHIGKVLSAKIPTGRGRREAFSRYHNRGRGGAVSVPDTITLSLPWGKLEVEEAAKPRRPRAVS